MVLQVFFGMLVAHFAIRGLMHDAALRAGEDPDGISFVSRPVLSNAGSRAFLLFPLRTGRPSKKQFSRRCPKSASLPAAME
jgi:hypothetical protein